RTSNYRGIATQEKARLGAPHPRPPARTRSNRVPAGADPRDAAATTGGNPAIRVGPSPRASPGRCSGVAQEVDSRGRQPSRIRIRVRPSNARRRTPMHRRHLTAALLVILTLATAAPSIAAGPCGTKRHRPRRWEHIVWIWFENHSYDQIIDSASAAFINGLASQCASAANFHNLTHVSLGNYIGAVTGLDNAHLQPFIFDCSPSGSCETSATSIFQQVSSWKAYM